MTEEAGMNAAALIVAAGSGLRAGAGLPKQFRPFAGKPMLRWSLEAFRQNPAIRRVVVVIDDASRAAFEACAAGYDAEIALGATTRTGSVRAGLETLARGEAPEIVLIHDAARPGVTLTLIDALIAALAQADAVAPALLVADALKRIGHDGAVETDVSRAALWRVIASWCRARASL